MHSATLVTHILVKFIVYIYCKLGIVAPSGTSERFFGFAQYQFDGKQPCPHIILGGDLSVDCLLTLLTEMSRWVSCTKYTFFKEKQKQWYRHHNLRKSFSSGERDPPSVELIPQCKVLNTSNTVSLFQLFLIITEIIQS